MADVPSGRRLRMHANYARLAELSADAHQRGRMAAGVTEREIALARLYSYAFRAQVIGAFHAARTAIKQIPFSDPLAIVQTQHAREALADLANRSMEPVGEDFRALISTFYHYHSHLLRTIAALDAACAAEPQAHLQRIFDRFVEQMESITMCNGLHLTRDTARQEQGGFIVPDLGIEIMPLIYGDFHSWNIAWLQPGVLEVPYHLHHDGIEIHLGYAPMHGYIVLGDCKAEVREAGYAMPIPPETRHGYTNIGSLEHHVPFIFGSLTRSGWGVFLDVEPQPIELERLHTVPMMSNKFNGTCQLEREIEKAAERVSSIRYPIIAAAATFRRDVGGLELAISRVTRQGLEFRPDSFRAGCVIRGRGILEVAGERVEINPRDHFGVPSGLSARVEQSGDEPLVLLDTLIRSNPRRGV